jgi:hypothetical protein
MPMPTIDLHVPCKGMYVPVTGTARKKENGIQTQDSNEKVEMAEAKYAVEGRTEAGNMLKMNGQDVKVDNDGTFALSLLLKEGENVYAVEITNPSSYTRYITMIVRATLEKARQRPERKKKDNESQLLTMRRAEQ